MRTQTHIDDIAGIGEVTIDMVIADRQRKERELREMLERDALRPVVTVEDYDYARDQLQREWREQRERDADLLSEACALSMI